jgi:hypothetical protein
MAAIKQSDEIEEYCAHGLNCRNQNTYCWRWHTSDICFFSMCYPKPNGSGYCFKGNDCNLEHPTQLNDDIWLLKSGKKFYFQDPKYKPEIAPDLTVEHKKIIRAEKKASRKAAKKPASDESWHAIQHASENKNDEVSPTAPTAPTETLVNMSTKPSWVAIIKAVEQHNKEDTKEQDPAKAAADAQTVPVADDFPELKSEPVTAKTEKAKTEKATEHVEKLYKQQTINTQAQRPHQDTDVQQSVKFTVTENKFSPQLQYINKNFLEDNFDPVHFAQLQSALQAEFEQMAAQLKLMQEQSNKLRKLQKAYAGYHAKD